MKTLDYIGLNATDADQTVKSLNQLLADLQIFYTNLRGAHWNIKGDQFFTLHSKLEELYNDANEKIDEVAERILALGGTPENRFSEYLKVSKIKEVVTVGCPVLAVKNVLNDIKEVIAQERKVQDVADKGGDHVTADMMVDYLSGQEKTVWLLVAYATSQPHD